MNCWLKYCSMLADGAGPQARDADMAGPSGSATLTQEQLAALLVGHASAGGGGSVISDNDSFMPSNSQSVRARATHQAWLYALEGRALGVWSLAKALVGHMSGHGGLAMTDSNTSSPWSPTLLHARAPEARHASVQPGTRSGEVLLLNSASLTTL